MENRGIPAKANQDNAREGAEDGTDTKEVCTPPDDDAEWWMPFEADLSGPEAAFHRRPEDEHPPATRHHRYLPRHKPGGIHPGHAGDSKQP
jgi:predicted component of type VI protein secretion system